MASFTRPFDPAAVILQTDSNISLPDPERAPADPIVVRRVARYAGSSLALLHVNPGSAASFDLFSPVMGTVRTVDLPSPTPLAGGVSQLLEISPLPFSMMRTLRALKQGLPTFYLGYNPTATATTPPADDDLVHPDVPIASSLAGAAYVGVLFQDRVAIAPWGWIELLRVAMQNSGDSSGATAWSSLATLYTGIRSMRVLDHLGHYAITQDFQIRIRKTDDTFEGPWTRTTGNDGDLEKAVNTDPLPRAAGLQASLFGTAGGVGEQTELKWIGNAPAGDSSLPVQSIYGSDLSSPPGEAILLPAGTERAHLQTLELARWFAPRPMGTTLARYHFSSHIEPIVDGVSTFKRLVDDLLASASPGNGAHFAGWAFKNFPLDPARTDITGAAINTTLTEITKRIIDNGGDARFLVYKFINFKTNPDTDAIKYASIALVALIDALIILSIFGATSTDAVGFLVIFAGYILSPASPLQSFSAWIEDKAEESKDIFDLLNNTISNIHRQIAIWSSHPMRLIDNPVATLPLPLNLDTYIDQFSAWHQKIQLIKRSPDTDGNQYVAYVGGIDINTDRVDTPGHQITSPFHDVHARVTGPASADVFKTWDERYAFDRASIADSLDPVFQPPTPESLPAQPAKHIAQVGRTYYKSNPVGGSTPLPFAPDGERVIHDTLIQAIKSAREYIYIEEQYFTPSDSQPPGSADTYFDALLDAASRCQRLLIIVPSETDQPFGDLRRRYLFNRLRTAWSDRVLIGSPLRRPILPNPGRLASEGRCTLMSDITTSDETIIIGPPARVPQTVPFWLWIDGEMMLSSGLPRDTTVDGKPCMEISVLRGSSGTDPRWGATVRNHKKDAAVTLAQLRGIYVHAKVMMIDDLFVSIGSANMNRRGHFSDGEINVFSIPEQLKSAPENPARVLRAALWAEHLGISPSMGQALLGDPISAFDLFRRSRYEGNRFTPFSALDIKPYLSIPIGDSLVIQLLSATAIGWEYALIPKYGMIYPTRPALSIQIQERVQRLSE